MIISGLFRTLVSTKRSISSTSILLTLFFMFFIVLSCLYLVIMLLLGRIRAILLGPGSWFSEERRFMSEKEISVFLCYSPIRETSVFL
jgi:hypothetical protein